MNYLLGDLNLNRRKQFNSGSPVVVSTTPLNQEEGSAVITLPAYTSHVNKIDLTEWLGQGIDGWVWACISQLRAFLNGQSITPRTIATYGASGLPVFFRFLTSGTTRCQPEQFNQQWVKNFVDWLNDNASWSQATRKSHYSHTKTVLIGLQLRGVLPSDSSIFPQNPFPNSNAALKGETPLSPEERARFVEALRNDIVAIHKGVFDGSEAEALTVHVLAIAIRTGLNPTPLLELSRDSLKPHPFLGNMKTLESFKRRGNSTHIKSLRFSREDKQTDSIPMDGVALFKMVLDRTQYLVDTAPQILRDRVWLYQAKGSTTTLSLGIMTFYIRSIINRHALLSDENTPLRMNISRLRKTLESRLWMLSDGDLFAVSSIMGHTPNVADIHYLKCTDEMRKNATFVGEALPDIFRGAMDELGQRRVIPIHKLENTPLGSCKDPINGDKAPKDGSYCSNFFSCFSCRSYAIVGSPKDLHRLFSFYWFLDIERIRTQSREWREQFLVMMTLIDSFTLDKFDSLLVGEAKAEARLNPIKFWKSYQLGEGGTSNA